MARSSTTFEKGKTGNPAGRPKLVDKLRKRALRAVRDEVLKAWIEEVKLRPKIGGDGMPQRYLDAETGEEKFRMERGADWVACGKLLAEYGIGKPVQPMAVSGDGEGAPVSFLVRFDRGRK
jgi:hypothetical protein